MIALQFFRRHWRPVVLFVALFVAFAAGRFTVHPKVETKTVEQVVYRDRVVKEVVKGETVEHVTTQVVYRDRTVIQHPDGTVEHRDVEKTSNGDDHKTGTTTTERDADTKTAQRSTETTKTVSAPPPSWLVGANVGVPLLLKPVGIGTPFVVVHVDRRIAGPVWLGAWGSLDVQRQNPAVGLSVGVSL